MSAKTLNNKGAKGDAPLSRYCGAGLLLVLLLALAACGAPRPGNVPAGASQAYGLVIGVQVRNIGEVETLRVREASGKVLEFTTEGFIGFTPSHLVEHQAFGQMVLVRYVEKDGRLVALWVEDYTPTQ